MNRKTELCNFQWTENSITKWTEDTKITPIITHHCVLVMNHDQDVHICRCWKRHKGGDAQ